MKRILGLAPTLFLAAGLAQAQPAAPAGAPPTGLVVGSGNYFSPIVRDLDAAIAFYRDGLGLEVQGAPGDASANPALRDMFGLPDAQIRWAIARTPAMTGGVEMVEIKNAGGQALERRLEDPGAISFVVTVRDLDGTLARLKALGAPMVSRSGGPVTIGAARASSSSKDPDGHFVELSQPAEVPSSAPAGANVIGVRLRLAVADVEAATRLYRDELGLSGARTARGIRQQRCRAGRARFGERPVSRRSAERADLGAHVRLRRFQRRRTKERPGANSRLRLDACATARSRRRRGDRRVQALRRRSRVDRRRSRSRCRPATPR